MSNNIADSLRTWANGSRPAEAAVKLIVSALDGRLLDGPWIRTDDQIRTWFDPVTATAEAGYLSGGEQRVLSVATSLVSDDHPVDLGDVITGLDLGELRLVLRALAHAGGLSSVFAGPGEDHHDSC